MDELNAKDIVKNFSKSLSESKVLSDDEDDENDSTNDLPNYVQNNEYMKHPVYKDGVLKFFPPVYVQRYETVALILKDPVWAKKIKKVVDFGCAELGFFMYLKNMENVTEILEVDVDTDLLERCSFKAAPLTSDFLMNKGNKPLDVYILAGSVAEYDDHLMGCDAVVAIELIEHLNEEAFKNMPYNIFSRIRPKLAIFTTPNADFNSLFLNFKDMRHEDHKFEWTRKEFFNWTQEILKLYPEYSIRFYGIGVGPEGTENLGCCSQMAVFQRSEESEPFSTARDKLEGIHNYKLIKHYKYPVFIDSRSREEKIIHEVQHQVFNLNALPTYYNFENNESEIPLSLLREYVSELCSDENEFQDILERNGMLLRKRNMTWFLVYTDPDSSSSDQGFQGEDWMNEDVSDNVEENEDFVVDELPSWDDEVHLEHSTKCARSLQVLEPEPKEAVTNLQEKRLLGMTEEVKSAPHSHNHLHRQKSPSKNVYINININKGRGDSDDNVKRKLSPVRSRIPRKKNENKDKLSSESACPLEPVHEDSKES